MTAASDADSARALHVDVALEALPLIADGPVVDVGTGGGSPGIPLAVACPTVEFVLLDSSARKAAFLRRWEADLPNIRVVNERAEHHAHGLGRDAYAIALARGLAAPAVALEWSLPLVRPGGCLVLFAGPTIPDGLDLVAGELAAVEAPEHEIAASRRLLIFEKIGPTPARYPRKPGIARKRPLA